VVRIIRWVAACLILALYFIAANNTASSANEPPIADSFQLPLKGDWDPVSQQFGKWSNFNCGYHLGEDVKKDSGTPVYAISSGIVRNAIYLAWQGGYIVVIEYKLASGDYITTVNFHMREPTPAETLSVGQLVSPSEPIGYLSDKESDYGPFPHLHFGIRHGKYEWGINPYTNKWYYTGYTKLYNLVDGKSVPTVCDKTNPYHLLVLNEWIKPSDFFSEHIKSEPSSPTFTPTPTRTPTPTITPTHTSTLTPTIPVGKIDPWPNTHTCNSRSEALGPTELTSKIVFTGDSYLDHPAIAADGTIYIGEGNSRIYALNPDGIIKWTRTDKELIIEAIRAGHAKNLPQAPNDMEKFVGGRLEDIGITEKGISVMSGGGLDIDKNGNALEFRFLYSGPGYFGFCPQPLYVNVNELIISKLNYDKILPVTKTGPFCLHGIYRCDPIIHAMYSESLAINKQEDTFYLALTGKRQGLLSSNLAGVRNWFLEIPNRTVTNVAMDANGIIYFAADNTVYAVDQNEKIQWQLQIPEEYSFSTLVIGDGKLYLTSGNKLYVVGE